jgi:hypothetical protein
VEHLRAAREERRLEIADPLQQRKLNVRYTQREPLRLPFSYPVSWRGGTCAKSEYVVGSSPGRSIDR